MIANCEDFSTDSGLAKRLECVELAPAFAGSTANESASKLDALQTLRDIRWRLGRYALVSAALIWSACVISAAASNRAGLTFCCSARNDLYLALGSQRHPRFESSLAA